MDSLKVRTDPVEQEPLHHFHPGTAVLRASQMPSDPGVLVAAAMREGARSLAVPERLPAAPKVARIAGLRGIHLVGSCLATELPVLFGSLRWFDAIVVRLPWVDRAEAVRAFESIARLLVEDVWVELACGVSPDEEGDESIDLLSCTLVDALGPDVPVHLLPVRFDAAGREQARHARWIAQANGLHWVYGGDPTDPRALSSWCPGCDGLLAERSSGPGALLLADACPSCGWAIPGRFPRDAHRRSSQKMARVIPPPGFAKGMQVVPSRGPIRARNA